MNTRESIHIRKWKVDKPPGKILVIRIQALGDLFGIFPFISDLKKKLPDTQIDLLTRSDYAHFAREMGIFDRIYEVNGGTSAFKRSWNLFRQYPRLFFKRYPVILDLQRNRGTRLLRRSLFPKAWSEMDRFSDKNGAIRYQWSIEQVGLGKVELDFSFAAKYHSNPEAKEFLQQAGWNGTDTLVTINPAGLFETRNWALSRYAEWMKKWLEDRPDTQFLILGVNNLRAKADYLQQQVPGRVLNLVGKTSILQAYQILMHSSFLLTEDSGLGHFGWLSGLKTLSILGSTRSDWTAPYGPHTAYFDSSHLPCGNCMLPVCIHPKPLCLDQLTVAQVYEKTQELLNRTDE